MRSGSFELIGLGHSEPMPEHILPLLPLASCLLPLASPPP